MSYEAALRLAAALQIEHGASFFIATVEQALPPAHGVDAVQPLSAEAISDLYRSVVGRVPPMRDRSGRR